METKIILDLCGGTGSWSKPYKDAGYIVYNITLPEYDVRTYMPPDNVYGILAAPPCTMFSFARTVAKIPRDTKSAMEIVKSCLNIIWKCQHKTLSDVQRKSPLKFWALENPNSRLNWFLGHPIFTFQPYEFGDGYSKKTCLWGYFNIPNKLPKFDLFATNRYGKKFERLSINELRDLRSISDITFREKNRQELRAITPAEFAKAFYESNK